MKIMWDLEPTKTSGFAFVVGHFGIHVVAWYVRQHSLTPTRIGRRCVTIE
jgi:hypothetical protein